MTSCISSGGIICSFTKLKKFGHCGQISAVHSSVSKGVVVQLNCWVLIFWGYRGLKKVVSYLGLIEVQYGRKNIVLKFIIIHLKSSAILG